MYINCVVYRAPNATACVRPVNLVIPNVSLMYNCSHLLTNKVTANMIMPQIRTKATTISENWHNYPFVTLCYNILHF